MSMAKTPYSCLEDFKANRWPRDCLIYLMSETDEAIYAKSNQWCFINKEKTLSKSEIDLFDIQKLPKNCAILAFKSLEFHKYRKTHLFDEKL